MKTNKEIIEEFRKQRKKFVNYLTLKYGTHIHYPQLQKFAEEFILEQRKALIKEFVEIVGEDKKITEKDWTLQNMLTSVGELKRMINQAKQEIREGIKKL